MYRSWDKKRFFKKYYKSKSDCGREIRWGKIVKKRNRRKKERKKERKYESLRKKNSQLENTWIYNGHKYKSIKTII